MKFAKYIGIALKENEFEYVQYGSDQKLPASELSDQQRAGCFHRDVGGKKGQRS